MLCSLTAFGLHSHLPIIHRIRSPAMLNMHQRALELIRTSAMNLRHLITRVRTTSTRLAQFAPLTVHQRTSGEEELGESEVREAKHATSATEAGDGLSSTTDDESNRSTFQNPNGQNRRVVVRIPEYLVIDPQWSQLSNLTITSVVIDELSLCTRTIEAVRNLPCVREWYRARSKHQLPVSSIIADGEALLPPQSKPAMSVIFENEKFERMVASSVLHAADPNSRVDQPQTPQVLPRGTIINPDVKRTTQVNVTLCTLVLLARIVTALKQPASSHTPASSLQMHEPSSSYSPHFGALLSVARSIAASLLPVSENGSLTPGTSRDALLPYAVRTATATLCKFIPLLDLPSAHPSQAVGGCVPSINNKDDCAQTPSEVRTMLPVYSLESLLHQARSLLGEDAISTVHSSLDNNLRYKEQIKPVEGGGQEWRSFIESELNFALASLYNTGLLHLECPFQKSHTVPLPPGFNPKEMPPYSAKHRDMQPLDFFKHRNHDVNSMKFYWLPQPLFRAPSLANLSPVAVLDALSHVQSLAANLPSVSTTPHVVAAVVSESIARAIRASNSTDLDEAKILSNLGSAMCGQQVHLSAIRYSTQAIVGKLSRVRRSWSKLQELKLPTVVDHILKPTLKACAQARQKALSSSTFSSSTQALLACASIGLSLKSRDDSTQEYSPLQTSMASSPLGPGATSTPLDLTNPTQCTCACHSPVPPVPPVTGSSVRQDEMPGCLSPISLPNVSSLGVPDINLCSAHPQQSSNITNIGSACATALRIDPRTLALGNPDDAYLMLHIPGFTSRLLLQTVSIVDRLASDIESIFAVPPSEAGARGRGPSLAPFGNQTVRTAGTSMDGTHVTSNNRVRNHGCSTRTVLETFGQISKKMHESAKEYDTNFDEIAYSLATYSQDLQVLMRLLDTLGPQYTDEAHVDDGHVHNSVPLMDADASATVEDDSIDSHEDHADIRMSTSLGGAYLDSKDADVLGHHDASVPVAISTEQANVVFESILERVEASDYLRPTVVSALHRARLRIIGQDPMLLPSLQAEGSIKDSPSSRSSDMYPSSGRSDPGCSHEESRPRAGLEVQASRQSLLPDEVAAAIAAEATSPLSLAVMPEHYTAWI